MPRLDIETRRKQLVEAAVRIALRDGLDNTTIRRIATEAGVSLGTVHYCFDGKDALLEAVVEYLFEREAAADPVTFPDDMDPVEAIREGFRSYWSLSGANREYQRLVYELVTYLVRQPEPGPQLARRIFQSNYAVIAGFMEAFRKKWGLRPSVDEQVFERMIIAMTDGIALAWLADEDEESALAALDAFAVMMAGVLVRE